MLTSVCGLTPKSNSNFPSADASHSQCDVPHAVVAESPSSSGAKSISTHMPDETSGKRFFHPNDVNQSSRAPGSSFSPESGPSSIRRAQAIPGLSGRARGLRTKETRAKSRGKFPRIPAGRVAPTCRREWAVVVLIVSSSAHRLPRTHRLPRAVKAAADGRPATRRGELMPARLYNTAYRVWPATFARNHLPHSTSAPRLLILELEQWRRTHPTTTARRTTVSVGDRCTSGRDASCMPRATWRRPTSGHPADGA
jgi:hypothetical protein